MQETWRWFGPEDSVSLTQIRQAGASGIVTALDQVPTGEAWPLADIEARQKLIAGHGLVWAVVESVPVHNDIKARSGDFERLIDNYRQTLRNLGRAGVNRVCYNFMPVVDWTRTNLDYELPNESGALRFEMADFVAYDVHMLQRPGAGDCYGDDLLRKAQRRFTAWTDAERKALEKNIIAGMPGGEGSYDRAGIREELARFNEIDVHEYRANLFAFLKDIVPVAEEAGVVLCVHPDDPPFSLFGLPRVVSTADDARALLAAAPSPNNALTLCAGSYGARPDNDLVAMAREFGEHIQFVHLRNVRREPDGSFYESEHLQGDIDVVGLIEALLDQERERRSRAAPFPEIAMRPDHGHALGEERDDPRVRPGYSYAGRMKGLAELRGVIYALQRALSGEREGVPLAERAPSGNPKGAPLAGTDAGQEPAPQEVAKANLQP